MNAGADVLVLDTGSFDDRPVALDRPIDPIAREFKADVYERMLEDDTAGSAADDLIAGIADGGVRVVPAVAPIPAYRLASADAEAVRKAELAAIAAQTVERLTQEVDWDQATRDTALAIFLGWSALAKQTEIIDREIHLVALVHKPQAALRIVTTNAGQVQGFVGATADSPFIPEGTMLTPDQWAKNFFPAEDFVFFSHASRKGDPRGRSIYRRAYNPWWFKVQTFPGWADYLDMHGKPGMKGRIGEETSDLDDPDDPGTRVARTTLLLRRMKTAGRGGYIALGEGEEVEYMTPPPGGGEAYQRALDACDLRIVRAIQHTARRLLEAEHGSKADTGEASDVTQLITRGYKRIIGRIFTRQVSHWLVRLNLPPEYWPYAPQISLEQSVQEDRTAELEAFSNAYARGFIVDEDLPALFDRLGIEPRDWEKWFAAKAERQARDEQARRDRLDARFPVPPGPDEDPDEDE